MQLGKPLEAGRLVVFSPSGEEAHSLLLDLGWRQVRRSAYAQALQQRFVDEGALEARPRVGDEGVHDGQSPKLAVRVAIFELLAQGTGGFRGASDLELDDLDQVDEAAQVILQVVFAREELDLGRDSRVRLLLRGVSVGVPVQRRVS